MYLVAILESPLDKVADDEGDKGFVEFEEGQLLPHAKSDEIVELAEQFNLLLVLLNLLNNDIDSLANGALGSKRCKLGLV